MPRLDSIDRHIVACLSQDARRSFREIGDQVGLSAPAVKRRVDRLRRQGVIKGFTTVLHTDVLDEEGPGAPVQAFVELFCRGRTSPQHLRDLFARHRDVRAAWTVTGEGDAVLHLQAPDMSALQSTLESIREDATVDHTRSVILLSTLVDRPAAVPTV